MYYNSFGPRLDSFVSLSKIPILLGIFISGWEFLGCFGKPNRDLHFLLGQIGNCNNGEYSPYLYDVDTDIDLSN